MRGKLTLKGGTPWDEEKAARRAKKQKKKLDKAAAAEAAAAAAAAAEAAEGGGAAVVAADLDADAKLKAALPKTYDEEFGLEAAARRAAGGGAAVAPPGAVGPHGHKFKAAPAVLHGYSAPVSGATAGERLDLRCATKADKFCR